MVLPELSDDDSDSELDEVEDEEESLSDLNPIKDTFHLYTFPGLFVVFFSLKVID